VAGSNPPGNPDDHIAVAVVVVVVVVVEAEKDREGKQLEVHAWVLQAAHMVVELPTV
jgi:hypothetical protein